MLMLKLLELIKKIGDIIEFGNVKLETQRNQKNSSYPLYSSSLEISNYIDDVDYDEEYLIVNTISATGRSNIHISNKFCRTSNTIIFKSLDNGKYYNKYIYHFLKINIQKLEECYNGSLKKKTDKTDIKDIEISIPLKEVQDEIVKYCDEKQKLIDTINNNIEENNNLMRNIINIYVK